MMDSAPLASSAIALLNIAACPCCKAALTNFARCAKCGTTFIEASIPCLIPAQACSEVSYSFSSDRSVSSRGFKEAFRYPPDPSISDLPYHLDKAHAAVIAELAAGASVLEIGCGGGQMRDYLITKGVQYIGTDISLERVLPHLRTKGGPDLLADAHFLPFRTQQFDVVYSAAVVEHLACPQLAALEVQRVLKLGGRFLGSVSFMEPWHDDSFFHMSPLAVYELMTLAGLTPEFVWPGKDYSGYNAMMSMGNRATNAVRFLGSLSTFVYRTSIRLRDAMRRQKSSIADDAVIGGAINWIASK